MMNQLLMSVLAQRKKEDPYVRFVSAEARTITPQYTNSGVTLQYSIDSGSTWTNITSGSATTSAKEHWFRGQATGTKSLFTSNAYANAWAFSGSSNLEVYGNLNFLLCDTLGDKAATTLASYCYYMMFFSCTSLTTAPELPATTLSFACYHSMFSSCTSLTTAPKLPATTLANNCYQNMFSSCTSLTTAPELPATTLSFACYNSMFRDCTSLTTAPELPATTLASYCYQNMFYGCTSLTTAPQLPATTMTTLCYHNMFRDCTSLTTAPELPATTLASYCYQNMFSSCTSFKVSTSKVGSYTYAWRIPTSGTGTTATATDWNYSMLYNTGGIFTSDPTINTTYYVENEPV